MNKMEQAVIMMRAQAAELAERRLDRKLTDAERAGLERIPSAMMLESICQSFESESYSAAQVAEDLAYFSTRNQS